MTKKSTRFQLEEVRDTIVRLEGELETSGDGLGEITWEDLASRGDEALKTLGEQEARRNAIPVALSRARVREQELLGALLNERIKVLETRRAKEYEKFLEADEVYQKAASKRAHTLGTWQDTGQQIKDLQSERGAAQRERQRLEAEARANVERSKAPVVRLAPSFFARG